MRLLTLAVLLVFSIQAFADETVEPTGDPVASGNTIDGSLNTNNNNTNNSTYENNSTYDYDSSDTTTVHGNQTVTNDTHNHNATSVTNNTTSTSRVTSGASAAAAVAPSMGTSGYDSCSQGISTGASGPGMGISFGMHKADKTCELIKLSKLMQGLGMKDGAVAILMQDKRTREALRVAYPTLYTKFGGEETEESTDSSKKKKKKGPRKNR